MPTNVDVTDDELLKLEQGGGLAESTIAARAKQFKDFNEFVIKETGKDIAAHVTAGEDGKKSVVNVLGKYFFSMRVTVNGGVKEWPKKGYAERIRSNLKMTILNEFKFDITDKGLFPQSARHWKSFLEQLVKEGRSETLHHPEVDPHTMEAINNLAVCVKEALESRGSEGYEEKLSKVPLSLRNKMNYVIQWVAMLQLVLFECRRGGENIDELKKSDFVVYEDAVKKFKYIKHMKSEKDKNHSEGTNSSVYGCIPCLNFSGRFNPGEFFEFYLQFVPDQCSRRISLP